MWVRPPPSGGRRSRAAGSRRASSGSSSASGRRTPRCRWARPPRRGRPLPGRAGGEAGREQRVGAACRLRRVGALDPERGDQRVTFQGGRQPLVAVVEQETGVLAPPELDRLGTVLAAVLQAEPAEQVLGHRPGAGVDGELDEREAVRLDRLGRAGQVQSRRWGSVHEAAQRLLEPDQGPHRVHRGVAGIGLAEDVVEDLQRQRPPIAGGDHPAEEPGQVEAALPGEAAVVAAPLEDVHGQEGGVGQLQEEELVRGDRADGVEVGAPERMWKLSRQTPSAGWPAASTIRQACS